jgi:hypothetical protein
LNHRKRTRSPAPHWLKSQATGLVPIQPEHPSPIPALWSHSELLFKLSMALVLTEPNRLSSGPGCTVATRRHCKHVTCRTGRGVHRRSGRCTSGRAPLRASGNRSIGCWQRKAPPGWGGAFLGVGVCVNWRCSKLGASPRPTVHFSTLVRAGKQGLAQRKGAAG